VLLCINLNDLAFLNLIFTIRKDFRVLVQTWTKTVNPAYADWHFLALNADISVAGTLKVSLYDNGGSFWYCSSGLAFFDNFRVQRVAPVVFQENHYDPWGLNLTGIEENDLQTQQNVGENRYQSNAGSERETSFGLEWLETAFRPVDAQVGRLWGVDALAMLTPGISPMAFALNNSVSLVDPTGLMAIDGGGAVCTNCVEEGSSASAPSDGQESVAQGPKAPQKQQNNKNDDFFFLQNQFGLEKNWGNHRRNTPPYAPYEALNQGFSKKTLFLDEVVINAEREEEINDDSPFLDILKKIRSPHKDLHKPLKNKVKSHGEDVVDAVGTAVGTMYLLGQDAFFSIAALHPILGIIVRNYHLAGSVHPTTGVPFNSDGFPDFSNHLYRAGVNDVKINPSFISRLVDEKRANARAGYSKTPKGYTWHHHQDYGRMQLVEKKIHSKTGHTGGYVVWILNNLGL
jgi:hypothetical protein